MVRDALHIRILSASAISLYDIRKDSGLALSYLGTSIKYEYLVDYVEYPCLLDSVISERNVEEVTTLFHKLLIKKLCRIDIAFYNTMLYNLVKAGYLSNACQIVVRMESMSYPIASDTTTYVGLMRGFIDNNELDKTHALFSLLGVKGLSLDVSAYTIVIESLLGFGFDRLETVKLLFNQMSSYRVKLNIAMLNVFVLSYAPSCYKKPNQSYMAFQQSTYEIMHWPRLRYVHK